MIKLYIRIDCMLYSSGQLAAMRQRLVSSTCMRQAA